MQGGHRLDITRLHEFFALLSTTNLMHAVKSHYAGTRSLTSRVSSQLVTYLETVTAEGYT